VTYEVGRRVSRSTSSFRLLAGRQNFPPLRGHVRLSSRVAIAGARQGTTPSAHPITAPGPELRRGRLQSALPRAPDPYDPLLIHGNALTGKSRLHENPVTRLAQPDESDQRAS